MNKRRQKHRPPALIIVGGFAGTGKTAISRRLSAELRIPRLGSDALGRIIRHSAGIKNGIVDAYWIAYDLLFCLCEEFIQSGISTILDLTMGWEFQWQNVDGVIRKHPHTLFLPIILRCAFERCIERIEQRYEENPEYFDSPEVYVTEPKNRRIWEFLARLDRPDIRVIDADRPHDEVYEEIREYISTQLNKRVERPDSVLTPSGF